MFRALLILLVLPVFTAAILIRPNDPIEPIEPIIPPVKPIAPILPIHPIIPPLCRGITCPPGEHCVMVFDDWDDWELPPCIHRPCIRPPRTRHPECVPLFPE
ncbi:hypothetical protein PRIPAC_77776 [Pristionchus pacificus]|uniref:Uncharacterized protein n=1 Tax=Pristionchus pacificus TaxID=54126 RepID=A0A2A6CMS1_PRIPA|nr:hypothetical protein PRIPAC_77776 [Pristionchus pacificus]|eukprot:PDM79353.1 hypothetical protein PRIPAC_31932 [Pristionchus pacificus]